MTETQELVTKLLAEGGKEFPHQWEQNESEFGCNVCGVLKRAVSLFTEECPVLLRAALDQTLKERDDSLDRIALLQADLNETTVALDLTRQQLAEALDPTVRE